MIDATVSRWAKWIQDAVIPQFSYLIETLRNFRPFENTSPEELQFQCIRLAIYAILLIILVSIGRKIGSWFMRTTAKNRWNICPKCAASSLKDVKKRLTS